MNKKEVLVCGYTGFIGRNIAERLAEREDMKVYGTYLNSSPADNPRITSIKADLREKSDVDRVVQGKDIIIQTAATTSGAKDIVTRPYIHVTDNALMNSLIFRASYEKGVSKLIFPSCTVMYQSSDTPVKETDFDAGDEINKNYFGIGWTKVYLEKMAEFYSRLGRTQFTVMRHSNIYGPHDKFDLEKSHVFGATMTKVLKSQDGKIKVWGTGEEERDLLYVSDLVDFVESAIDKQESRFELLNVGLGRSTPVRDLVGKIITYSGKDMAIEYDTSQPTIKTKLCLDCKKAKEKFGWAPRVTLDDGIQKTIDWYRKNIP